MIPDAYFIPLEITNAGNGCALRCTISLKIHDGDLCAKTVPVSIPVGNKLYIGCFFDIKNLPYKQYDFCIEYCDIYGNEYAQKSNIEITITSDNCVKHTIMEDAQKLLKSATVL